MTKDVFLEHLKRFTEWAVRDLRFPVQPQETDAGPPPFRRADVYRMHLPEGHFDRRRAPFVLHQLLTGKDLHAAGRPLPDASVLVRTVFCVYHEDAQEGELALLNLMEQLRVALLEHPLFEEGFELDLKTGLESLIYPDDDPPTYPFYLGEMVSTWKLPPIQRLDAARVIHGMPAFDPHPVHLKDVFPLKGSDEHV